MKTSNYFTAISGLFIIAAAVTTVLVNTSILKKNKAEKLATKYE
jgi:hypothetical protein